MDETALAQAAQTGDTEALQTLFESNRRRIHALAWQYTRNVEDAEDIFQETFIRAYNHLGSFRAEDDTSFTAWLYRIGINCSIDHLRKKKRRREVDPGETDIQNMSDTRSVRSPDSGSRDREIREETDRVLAGLSSRQRMIFILRHTQQMSIREISEYMGCSEGSIKKQLFRAVGEFKKHLRHLIPEKSDGL